MSGERVLYGVAGSPGIGMGHALVYREKPMGSLEREVTDVKLELERYHNAVETFCRVTEAKADRVAEMAGKEQGDIIRCQSAMIRDPYLNGQVEGRIASRQSAEEALSASCDLFIDLFTASDDEVTRQREFLQLRASLREFVGRQTVTAEGQRIHLFANAGSVADASRAAGYGCDGIGLVRTEFLYLDRTSQPGEEEQFHAYRQILSAMRDKPVIIRTLDVGGDKELPYLDQPQEENPFLGCRGLRFSLREEDMFRVHLRAVLRASAYGKAQLLLPMVTGVEEIRRAREILEEEKEVLRRRRVAFDEHLPMGAMVETVAACLMAEAMAKEVDFFSIGTNDLTQYILGVDRGNARVAHLYSYFHPAVLRQVRQVLEAARNTGTPVGMCGEAAADTALTPVLLTFGLEDFSVAPVSLLPVRKAISLWNREEARAVTEEALALDTEEEVRQYLKSREKR